LQQDVSVVQQFNVVLLQQPGLLLGEGVQQLLVVDGMQQLSPQQGVTWVSII